MSRRRQTGLSGCSLLSSSPFVVGPGLSPGRWLRVAGRERDFPAPRPGRPCKPSRQEPVGTYCSQGCPACKPQSTVGGLQPPQASQTSCQRRSHCRFLPSPARPGASPGDGGEPEGAAGVPSHHWAAPPTGGVESWWGREPLTGGPGAWRARPTPPGRPHVLHSPARVMRTSQCGTGSTPASSSPGCRTWTTSMTA